MASSSGEAQEEERKKNGKLRKIPPIPIRRVKNNNHAGKLLGDEGDRNDNGGDGNGGEDLEAWRDNDGSHPIIAPSLHLNRIKTRENGGSAPAADGDRELKNLAGRSLTPGNSSTGLGKKSPWCVSKSFKVPHVQSLEMEGVEGTGFEAILRVTSGQKKKFPPGIKSFSHELNSKEVRPLPFWKPRRLSNHEDILLVIRSKFDRLKEEVDSELGLFAGDLVSVLENNVESHPDWKETLEDLLLIARQCATMSCDEFWLQSEAIVQKLDDRRQELPIGILKQLHARILFILTRCTRLLQFHKETGLAGDDHNAGHQQFSDLGVYQGKGESGEAGLEYGKLTWKHVKVTKEMSNVELQHLNLKQDNADNRCSSSQPLAVDTAKSVDSSSGRDRISSWKKLPSAKEKNQTKSPGLKDSPSGEQSGSSNTSDISNAGPELETGKLKPEQQGHRFHQRNCRHKQSLDIDNVIICRICEDEIPTIRVEDHSKICALADRCDLKGLGINERLERICYTLERILDSSSPKSSCTAGPESPDFAKVPHLIEDSDFLSPFPGNIFRACSVDMINGPQEADQHATIDGMKGLPGVSNVQLVSPVVDSVAKATSTGSVTPQSSLLVAWDTPPGLLPFGSKALEHENYHQIHDLLDITQRIGSINGSGDQSLEHLLSCLEDLQDLIQEREVDALVVETFGRRVEKLLREKYLHLCQLVEDDRTDLLNNIVDDYCSLEEDTICSLRTSPINSNCKDRTSIDDFEILKPISRGAFGRVFLARKRATGDLFAIKVLKKADTIRKNAVDSILAERNILISVQNPFVVRFFYSFTCRENLYLVMEYLNGGDLYSLLRNLGCLSEDVARVYIAEVVLALEYLHSMNVIHRDLKPDNLLIAHDGHIKLTDFGLSKVGLINSTDDLSGPTAYGTKLLRKDESSLSSSEQSFKREECQRHTAVGTPDYLAPEILLGTGHGTTADWWSVGVILFEMIVGIPPFNAERPEMIFYNILNRQIPWPQIPEEMSYEAYDLINKLLIENPVQRLGATGAGEVKNHVFFRDINWETLARQKAAFVPAAEDACDTSYFACRYNWNQLSYICCEAAAEHDDASDTCSMSCGSSTPSNLLDEENLSQLASINYDVLVRSTKDSPKASNTLVP
ncbi:probable serine/threonine protein kinase IRE isoform X2 [Nymphaea colorata]|uniref:probable serine/threonine protein kinase IRE isoform X2 n=1 Tax=Nymphaea colorata TaxID=210225 RepID=UPI00129E1ECF|nr:probable serine/threonine protein kinase IRE isoform X2 [Nymphaea colorata]